MWYNIKVAGKKLTNILEYKEDVKMESNSGTKITIRAILVIGVVFLAVGVLTSITNESKVVDAEVIKVATIEEQENILHTDITELWFVKQTQQTSKFFH